MILEMEKEIREGGDNDIYQKSDVEHILNGLGESLQVQDELYSIEILITKTISEQLSENPRSRL